LDVDGNASSNNINNKSNNSNLSIYNDSNNNNMSDDVVHLLSCEDFGSYNNPLVPGAVLKCVLLAMKVVRLGEGVPSLHEQIQMLFHKSNHTDDGKVRVGLEVVTSCNLPTGTGLGVSSILAALLVSEFNFYILLASLIVFLFYCTSLSLLNTLCWNILNCVQIITFLTQVINIALIIQTGKSYCAASLQRLH
jgi:hypothetical protein